VDEREAIGHGLPRRRHGAVDDAVGEQPPGESGLALERADVRVCVPAPERHACDEVMEDEVVQHHDARIPLQQLEDPPVGVRVVADVEEADVHAGRQLPRTPSHDAHVDALAECGEEQGAVVGHARRLGRQGRGVGDPHQTRQVSLSASRRPRSPAPRKRPR
jgi:hypothetical protein